MGLNGIDISSWQDDLVVSGMTTCDFVIVKATGGAGYANECFLRHAVSGCQQNMKTCMLSTYLKLFSQRFHLLQQKIMLGFVDRTHPV